MASYTTLASSCDGGDCPKIHQDTSTGDVLIQGYLGAGPDVPDGEGTVRIPQDTWRALLAQLAR